MIVSFARLPSLRLHVSSLAIACWLVLPRMAAAEDAVDAGVEVVGDAGTIDEGTDEVSPPKSAQILATTSVPEEQATEKGFPIRARPGLQKGARTVPMPSARDDERIHGGRRQSTHHRDAKRREYVRRAAGGAVITILGGLSLLSGIVGVVILGVERVAAGFSSYGDHEKDPDDDVSGQPWAAPVSLLCGSVVALAVGLPLFISGRRKLKRHDRLMGAYGAFGPTTGGSGANVDVSLLASAGSGTASFQMVLEF